MFSSPARRAEATVNASSMADIAFLLLVFFLVTTTIDVEKGIRVKLPPVQVGPPPKVPERNIFSVKINFADELLVRGKPVQIGQLRAKAKEFILNPDKDENLAIAPDQAIISIQNDRNTTYQKYISVYNELKAAYNELWEEEAQRQFRTSFEKLSRNKRKAVQKKIPLVISEGEVVDLEN
ncbi:MAG TPA: biopolymer transporter ExbD [Bacteroidetes bacterium]|nr:biopolymer transporter ExbD [Bacteroidota bacterium]